MYPKIDQWIGGKVRSGIQERRRSGFVGYHKGIPAVSAVVKHGNHAKFCHLKVDERFRGSNIGEFVFALMAIEVRRHAQHIHFTLPENLWQEKKEFFSSFAFRDAKKSGKQYRLFENELHCNASFDVVWRSVVQKLPKLRASLAIDNCSQDSELLVSVRPRYAESILRGNKTVEVRRSFSSKWLGSRVAFYASAPVSSLVGEAVIEHLVEDAPDKIWNHFCGSLGCTKVEFDAYTAGANKVFALVLSDIRTYVKPLALNAARDLTGERLVPPQNYSKLTLDSPWSRALPIASIVQRANVPTAI
jgi:predicted transcriptional regulator